MKWLSKTTSKEEDMQLKQLAKDDAFLKDAMDAYKANNGTHVEDIARIRKNIRSKYAPQEEEKTVFPIYRIAASVAILLVAGGLIWYANNSFQSSSLAEQQAPILEKSLPETASSQGRKGEEVEDVSVDISNTTNEAIVEEKEEVEFTITVDNNPPIKTPPDINILDYIPKDLTLNDGNSTIAQEENMTTTAASSSTVPSIPETSPSIIESLNEPEVIEEENRDDAIIIASSATEEAIPAAPTTADVVEAEMDVESVIAENEVLAMESSPALDRSIHTIEGRVVNETGEPLIGANISHEASVTQAMTDFDGNFKIEVNNLDYPIQVNYVGYNNDFVAIDTAQPMLIQLQESGELADALVTAGNIVAKKRDNGAKELVDDSTIAPEEGFTFYSNYINKNMNYPQNAFESNIEGKVVLQFDINGNGVPVNIKIQRSLGYGCDEEAIRLLEDGPKWRGDTSKKKASYTVKFKKKKKKKDKE